MTDRLAGRRLFMGLAAFFAGTALVLISCAVLAAHARLFGQKRDTAVMVGTQLPELKSSVALLAASVEAEQIFAEQALLAREEQAAAYILPEGSPVGRAVSAIQETMIGFKKGDGLTLEKLSFGQEPEDHGSIKTTAGTMVLRGPFADVAAFLTVLGYGGDMMIRDVIPVADQQVFLALVEETAPLSLKGAEDFLYLDLVQYASSPDREEQRILADAAPEAAGEIRTLLLQIGLAGVRSALGPVAPHLKARELWPLPLLRIDRLTRDGDRWTADITLYSR
jgi:hypothetical protein